VHWQVRALTQDRETFQQGLATVVAVGRAVSGGRADDAHAWLVNVTLSEE
jgi:hypothetical protein